MSRRSSGEHSNDSSLDGSIQSENVRSSRGDLHLKYSADQLQPAEHVGNESRVKETGSVAYQEESEEDYTYALESGMPDGFDKVEGISARPEFHMFDNTPTDSNLQSVPTSEKSELHARKSVEFSIGELDPDPDEEDESDVPRKAPHSSSFTPSKLDPVPICNKISSLLSDRGFPVVKLIESDVDTSNNTVSVFVMESWADAVLGALVESMDTISRHQNSIKSSVVSSRLDSVSKDALMSKVDELERKMSSMKRREDEHLNKIRSLEEERNQRIKAAAQEAIDSKKHIRSAEQRIQEMERKMRQKEAEMDRLRETLSAIAQKERESKSRHRQILQQVRAGDLSFASSTSSSPSNSPHSTPSAADRARSRAAPSSGRNDSSFLSQRSATTSRSSAKRAVSHSGGTGSGGTGGHGAAVGDPLGAVVEALEAQKHELHSRNLELELQVADLVTSLKAQQNSAHNQPLGPSSSRKRFEYQTQEKSSKQESADDTSTGAHRSETSKRMYETIKEQEAQIDGLLREVEVGRVLLSEQQDSVSIMRSRAKDLRDEIDNLRIELDSRPTVRQLAATQRERDALEERLHDLIMLRGDSREVEQWRKHLSTADRIKVDKRNHELGLWVLDSLPKATMKEVLQAVCRELDITEISDLQPCVVKLKAVVRTIPRMERFISQVCTFVYQRHPTLGDIDGMRSAATMRVEVDQLRGQSEFSLELILPILRRWWYAAQRCVELDKFYDRVLLELYRRQEILARRGADSAAGIAAPHPKHLRSEVELQLLQEQWQTVGKLQWAQRDPQSIFDILRDLVDFQTEVMHHDQSLRFADDYIRQRPELIVSRVVSHIKYLFNIQSGLDGIIPRMNQVYLFTEEMRNFLGTMRAMLADFKGGSGGTSSASFRNSSVVTNAMVLAEIQRRLGGAAAMDGDVRLNVAGTGAITDGLLRQ